MKPFPKPDVIPYGLDDYKHPGRIPVWREQHDGNHKATYTAEMEECDYPTINAMYESLMKEGMEYKNIREACFPG